MILEGATASTMHHLYQCLLQQSIRSQYRSQSSSSLTLLSQWKRYKSTGSGKSKDKTTTSSASSSLTSTLPPSPSAVKTASFHLKRKVVLPLQPLPFNPLIVGPFLRAPRYKEPRPVGDFIYEEVEQKEVEKEDGSVEPKLRLILLQTVDELGVAGEVVEVDRDYGRNTLLSARLAVYADEFNLEKYQELIAHGSKSSTGPSSAYVMRTVKQLANTVVVVVMNDQNRWTVNTDHVRIALRVAGFHVPSKCITLPRTPITGPDIEGKQGKDFAVMITINGREQVPVRCMLHHKNLPLRLDWDCTPRFVLLEDDVEQCELLLAKMPIKEALRDDEMI